jgi:hypothetical protein
MDQPVLPPLAGLDDLPGRLDDLRHRPEEAACFSYRSEAFAEDLDAAASPRVAAPRGRFARVLAAAPFGGLFVGAALALLSQVGG